MSSIKLTAAILAIALLTLVASCGGDDNTGSPTPSGSPLITANSGQPPSPTVHACAPAGAGSATCDLPIPEPNELHVVGADGTGDSLLYTTDSQLNYAWSHDGNALALADGTVTAFTTVRILGLDGAERANFVESGSASDIRWSPDGRYVVLSINGGQSLIALPSVGGAAKELAHVDSSASIAMSGWLPDGELLATKQNKLVAFDLDNGATRDLSDLTIQAGYFGQPSLSPDGRSLAVSAADAASADCQVEAATGAVWIVDVASGVAHRANGPRCGIEQTVWSPDGGQLAFSDIARGGGLFVLDLASGRERQLSSGLDRPVVWRSDGKIVGLRYHCTGCDGPGPSTWVIDAATGEFVAITSQPGSAISPTGDVVAVADGGVSTVGLDGRPLLRLAASEDGWGDGGLGWSPDGRHVTYTRSRSQGTRVFEVNTGHSGFGLLLSRAASFELSPDGKRIAYTIARTQPPDTTNLAIANADGSQEITVDVAGGYNFSWSPDSSRLLFYAGSVTANQTPALYVVAADGSGLRQVATPVPYVFQQLYWSPDNVHAVFMSAESLAVVDVDTGQRIALSGPSSFASQVSWSSNGQRIAYVAGGGVYVAGLDGTAIFSISQVAPNYVPEAAISPDGEQLAIVGHDVQRGHELIVADITTGNQGMVLEGTIEHQSQPAWSPNGQWIAMSMATASGTGIFIVRPDGSETRQLTRGDIIGGLTWVSNDRIRFTSSTGGL